MAAPIALFRRRNDGREKIKRARIGAGAHLFTVTKRVGLTLLQFLVTAAAIYYVFHDAQKRAQIWEALLAADWRWLAASWLVYGAVEAIATVRWQMLLRVQRITVSWLRAGVIVTVGLFFNLFLPGLIGGDAMRLYLLFQKVPRRKTRATLSVVMDRMFGLFSLITLAAVVVWWRFGWLQQAPQTARVTYLALGLLGGAGIFLLLLLGAIAFHLAPSLPRPFPFRHAILETSQALHLYRRHPRTIGIAFALTIVSHLAYYLSYYCAMRSLPAPAHETASIGDFFSIMPLVNTITGIPISFGGVGVRETLFQTLLGQLAHVPVALAAVSASLGYAVQASWGLIGGAAYLFLRPARSSRRTARRGVGKMSKLN